MLVRCLYASRAINEVNDALLRGILEQSRSKNLHAGITGLLVHIDGVFVQALEGGRAEISRLLFRLTADERHTDVTLLSFGDIAERTYATWTMGHVDMGSVNPALALKRSPHAHLDPFTMSASAAEMVLADLAAAGAVVNRQQ